MNGQYHSKLPVEAESLSTLTSLAANPPLNPRILDGRTPESIVLYLARVPGSRDVFLTPLKPREKTVTAEDVESCLYYVHFDDPSNDQQLLDTDDGLRARLPVGRPLPATPDDVPKLPPRPNELAPILPPRPNGLSQGTSSVGTVKRKPVGSVSTAAAYHGDRTPAQPLLPPRPMSKATTSSSLSECGVPTATLVRRDPSSAMQWNVAKIMDPPVKEVSSDGASGETTVTATGSPIYLEIFNEGYQKFISGQTQGRSYESYPSGHQTPESMPSLAYSTGTLSDAAQGAESAFRRRMWMEGSHFLAAKHRSRASVDFSRSEEPLESSPDVSGLSVYGTREYDRDSLHVPHDGRIMASGGKRSAMKGYTFLSPWQGRCEFSASTLGTALKCRHCLPDSNEPVSVSELRFNLPSRASHRKSSSHSSIANPGLTPPSRPRSRKAHSFSSAHDEFEGLDLSLGQELAGGGATGKQAKLGKLIIDAEGLKMMDLVVASNMGLWWRAYGRSLDPGI